MNVELLSRILAVPTTTHNEDLIKDWLVAHCSAAGYAVEVDRCNNVYVTRGQLSAGERFPLVCAHIDTVFPIRKVQIEQDDQRLIGISSETGRQCGFGADDKAGVYICIELLDRLPVVKAVFFAGEEPGCIGSRRARESFFEDVGYAVGYDCPSTGMISYSLGGTVLFEESGPFMGAARPVLDDHGFTSWQRHPYTDVMILRQRFPISCLNLPAGYYRWHRHDEFVWLPDVDKSLQMSGELFEKLGRRHYPCPLHLPPCEETHKIDPLLVVEPVFATACHLPR